MIHVRVRPFAIALVVAFSMVVSAPVASAAPPQQDSGAVVLVPVAEGVGPSIAGNPSSDHRGEVNREMPLLLTKGGTHGRPGGGGGGGGTTDGAPQTIATTALETIAGPSFDGAGKGIAGYSPCCAPPDTNASVGTTQVVQWVNLDFAVFYNVYPDFEDTNNLSLVLFLHYPGLSIVFPGDLEKAGWRTLLRQPVFRQHLAKVNIFVASHHGRESGYANEVFQFCNPAVVIISDESKQFDTQETNYAQHAIGITWNQGETRRVLTTLNDGMLTISTRVGAPYFIQATK